MKKYAYLGKGKKYNMAAGKTPRPRSGSERSEDVLNMLKITTNEETAKENAPYVETDIEFKKERENQVVKCL